MKTILVFREEKFAWAHEAFPFVHPLLLPLCNKPYIEYPLDLAILAGSTAVRIVCDGRLDAVESYCEDGSRWGIDLSYAHMHPEDSDEILLGKNRRFCGDERIMIVRGFCFFVYNKRFDYKSEAASLPECKWAACPAGGSITLYGAPVTPRKDGKDAPMSIVPLDGMANYYRASMEALETGADNYVLPGYGVEPGCAIGRNVVMSKSVQIRKPVNIGNNVQLLGDTIIGPSAIIGSNVIIDRQSVVESSIVLDNTYIGEHLEVNGRVASGNMLNDPVSGASIVMEDPHLLSGIRESEILSTLPRKLTHALIALLFIVVLSFPFLLFAMLLRIGGLWKSSRIECHSEKPGKTISLDNIELDVKKPLGAIAAALSMDRYPMLFRVLTGQLSLIGSTARVAEAKHPNTPSSSLAYRPAVFSYAEAEEWPTTGGDAAIVERYHLAHSNAAADVGLVFKAFINNFHKKSSA
ncbi:MAG: NDP-sugar synthase [Chlorobaculum sp.]|nr:NDP-sugar synthase [Chlorobaculum sp.]